MSQVQIKKKQLVWHPVIVFFFFMADQHQNSDLDIVQAFRQVYMHIVQNVENVLAEATDSTVLSRILDEIDEYQALFLQVCAAKLCT